MKSMRLKVDEMYDFKVISPTTAEKVLAATSPRKWKKLQDHITQSQGKPSVAPASDKRAALNVKVQFENLDAAEQPATEAAVFAPIPETAEDLI